MTTAIISHPDCALHDMGQGHPESPLRLSAIQDQLIASGIDQLLSHYEAPLAEREQLQRVHDTVYIDSIFNGAPQPGHMTWIDPDTAMNEYTLNAALRAAGAPVLAVDLLLSGKVENAFCNVRPPGHHAERKRAMGFCFFNNVAVGAAYALDQHKLERVAIVDFDVHHGNGTEDIFQDNSQVLFCSTFQHPFYPYTGAETDAKNIVNVPLSTGAQDADFQTAVTEHWLPKLHEFKPQLVFVSAGFDAHVRDELAGLALTEESYRWVTNEIATIADQFADGHIISCLEGGYDLPALGRSAVEHIRVLTQ
ncbi:MAG: histone deacetylase family protein [Gammaproteobacteria bacterium]|jgi:acetoin utilization deacetylase AcuC-like enzyme